MIKMICNRCGADMGEVTGDAIGKARRLNGVMEDKTYAGPGEANFDFNLALTWTRTDLYLDDDSDTHLCDGCKFALLVQLMDSMGHRLMNTSTDDGPRADHDDA